MNSINRRSLLLAGLGAAGAGGARRLQQWFRPRWQRPGQPVRIRGRSRRAEAGPHRTAAEAHPDRRTRDGRPRRRGHPEDLGLRRTYPGQGGPAVRRRHPGRRAVQPTPAHDHHVDPLARHRPAQRHGRRSARHAGRSPGRSPSRTSSSPTPGTYFFHPHVGVQLDRGLYAPLIVEDPKESLAYDDEWVVLLDDWVDGVTGTPDEVFAELRQGMGGMEMDASSSPSSSGMEGHDMGDMGGMDMGSDSASPSARPLLRRHVDEVHAHGRHQRLLGGDAGDVKYPHHLINGRVASRPGRLHRQARQEVRLRIINAGSDTAYRVALGAHRLTITHTDGFPVQHQEVDALLVGMGERYDVLVTLGDGVFPLVALAEGKDANGLALVRTGSGSKPSATVRPKELDGMIMTASQLRAADDVRLKSAKTDVTHQIKLTGDMDEVQLGHQRHAVRHEGSRGAPDRHRGGPAGTARLRQRQPTCGTRCTCTATRTSSAPSGRARTPRSCCPRRSCPCSSTPTTRASGCCTATTPTTARPG